VAWQFDIHKHIYLKSKLLELNLDFSCGATPLFRRSVKSLNGLDGFYGPLME